MNAREVISLFYPDPKTKLGELMVDAFINEKHMFSSEITEHPIESGSVIGDHIYHLPFSLSIDGIISNTPMNLIGLTAFDSAKRFLEESSNDFAHIAFEKIEELFRKREPITISTSLKTYHNMVLESLHVERGNGNAESLHFTASARQIGIVQQQKIEIPKPKSERVKPIRKKGFQETKPLAPEQAEVIQKNNSFLFSLGKKLFGG
jgi:hypothetical protein